LGLCSRRTEDFTIPHWHSVSGSTTNGRSRAAMKIKSGWFKDQRKKNPYFERLNFSSAQGTLRRLDKAFQNFFRRVNAGEEPGYPRFKSADRFNSILLLIETSEGLRWFDWPEGLIFERRRSPFVCLSGSGHGRSSHGGAAIHTSSGTRNEGRSNHSCRLELDCPTLIRINNAGVSQTLRE
jgi:hypothetical protein